MSESVELNAGSLFNTPNGFLPLITIRPCNVYMYNCVGRLCTKLTFPRSRHQETWNSAVCRQKFCSK